MLRVTWKADPKLSAVWEMTDTTSVVGDSMTMRLPSKFLYKKKKREQWC